MQFFFSLLVAGPLLPAPNPGYNKDRGPTSFYAIRLHWES
jgi:hypothetical protein